MHDHDTTDGEIRQRFPKDGRDWFRVCADLLDDPKLNGDCSADVFRFYVRLLAMLSRTRSQDGSILLDRRALALCAGREQHRHALRVAREGAARGLYTLSTEGAHTLTRCAKWPELQGLTLPNRIDKKREEKKDTHTPAPVSSPPPKPKPQPQPREKAKPHATPFPSPFPQDVGVRLVAWGKGEGWSEAEVRRGISTVRDWAEGGGHRRSNWEAVVRNGIRRGWALEASEGKPAAERKNPYAPTAAQLAQRAERDAEIIRAQEFARSRLTDSQRASLDAAIAAGTDWSKAMREVRASAEAEGSELLGEEE